MHYHLPGDARPGVERGGRIGQLPVKPKRFFQVSDIRRSNRLVQERIEIRSSKEIGSTGALWQSTEI
jgi:hypothetical protein